uniref:Transmembrane protein n=1 Tax=Ascaris lumbricoides TaxID=6252 RepID=A0A0M3IND2_ASCLU
MVNEELGSSTTSDTAEATRWMAIFTSHSVEIFMKESYLCVSLLILVKQFHLADDEDVLGELRKVEPFYVDECFYGCVGVSEKRNGKAGFYGCVGSLVDVVVGDEAIESRRMKEMCGALFVYFDLYILTLKRIVPKIANLSSNIQKWNVYRLLRFFPLPTKKYSSPFYQVEGKVLHIAAHVHLKKD